jgi:hemoglobin-like flavoprotein
MPCPFSQFSRVAPGGIAVSEAAPDGAGASLLGQPPRESVGRSRRAPVEHPLVPFLLRLDGIDRFALVLLCCGVVTFLVGMWMEPPASFGSAVEQHYPDWAPGLVTDGILLLVVNSVLRRHERRRVLSQIGSLSREFALDAVRRARGEGWLSDGSLVGMALGKASLAGVDLSDGALRDVDLSYSDLRGATLAYADLRCADLTGCDLTEADLRWTDLRGARLTWADLRGAMLDGSLVDGADTRFASVDPRVAGTPGFAQAIVGGFLDDQQIGEVRRTFDRLLEAGTAPIEHFYHRLFEDLPEVKGMFRTEPRIQARKFLQSLKVIVSALHAPQRHVTVLQRLGQRHDAYGVMPHHYPVVANTLMTVMADALGPAFTPEARSAWERAFALITMVMIGGGGVERPSR